MESLNPNISLLATRPAVMTVDLGRLARNAARIRDHVCAQSRPQGGPAKVMAVVKANAYGHGLERCALHLEANGVDYLGCAYVEEGIILRKAGVKIHILVFGGILADQARLYIENDLDITASSVSKLDHIEATAAAMGRRARVHLKIDTGMERLGVHHDTAHTLLERTLSLKWCDVTGIFSHLARSDEDDFSFTMLQLERFHECTRFFERYSLPMPIRHIANSAAILRSPETHLDMVRPGIALYGVQPGPLVTDPLGLEPVLSLATKVVYFKVVKAGHGVSYGHLWKPENDTRVVTLPVGYGDGYPRALSNKAEVLIRGRRVPVVGAICMDQLMVDIGEGEAYNGDDVILIGSQDDGRGKSTRITVEELAARAGTIAYEILVGLNARIPRRYVEG